jgi:hypothetical protein
VADFYDFPLVPEHQIDPSLITLADKWSWYWDQSEHRYVEVTPRGMAKRVESIPVRRCCACHEEIYFGGAGLGIVGHLLLSHGFRMDGRQWNNQNELIGHA